MYSALAPASGQSGGWAAPDKAQAACRAAPSATYSAGSGTVTGTPKISGAIARTAAERAAPPIRITRCAAIPQSARLSMASASEQSTASQALQAYRIRDVAAELSATHWKTARERAAQQAPAAQPAAQATSQSTATSQPTASAQPTAAVTTFAAPVASGSPQQIAEAMLGSFGWSSSQFSCLDPLWAHESGWSVTAYNAGSGAYGIPQALPGSRMASAGPDWQTSAATQIRWGLEYIKGTYGSPCGAWDHEQATGWY